MFDFRNDENKLTLIGVVLLGLIITSVIIYLNSTHYILGHSYRDVFFYLIQSLRMSGVEISGYAYVNYLSPFIPFLTSILFKMGFVNLSSIFITSGAFFFIGILGMYFILKLKFNNFYSFFGSFLYATLFINVLWVGNGTLDIGFVALMIWAIYFFAKAMEDNQKYFYLAFPIAVLSFFTKYTGAIVIPIMAVYFLSKPNFIQNFKKYFKHLLGGVIAGVLTSIPFFLYYFLNNIPLGFLNQASEVSSESSLAVTHKGVPVGNDLFFYIKGLIYDISSTDYIVGVIILVISIIGFIFVIYTLIKTLKNSQINSKTYYITFITSIALILISFFTASLFSFVFSELILFLGLYLFAYSLNNISPNSFKYLSLNLAMFSFFMFFMVFFTAHLTKADRYFISMAPGFIFLIVLSVDFLLNNVKKFRLNYIVPVFLMCLMLFACVNYLSGVGDDSLAVSEKHASDWISDKEGIIYSDRGPVFTWYLQKEVAYARNPGNNTLLNQELLEGNATYYISSIPVNLTDYKSVKEFGDVNVYRLK